MALVLKDRVKETSTTAGTGTLTLAGAVSGFQSFAAVGNGNTTYYAIADSITGDWEVGIGTYTSSGTTLSRTTVLSSSNSGSLVPFASNPKDVFVTYPSEKSVYEDASNVVNATSFGAITATSAALTTGTVSTTPASNTDIANKQYVDGLVTQGISYHEPVYVESPNTTGNLNATYNNGASGVGATLTNAGTQVALTVDGILMTVGKRVLIYNQTNATQNGVYTVTTVGDGSTNWVLTRSADANTYGIRDPNALGYNDAFFVTNGNTGAGETYVCTTTGTITFGTTNITFAQISSAQVYTAGTGLNLSPATTFNISNTGVSASTYGSASAVPVFAVNAQGQLTSVTNTAIAISGAAVSGNISGSSGSVANALTLGTYLTGTSYNGSSAVTAAVDATSTNTASKVVARDSSGNFAAGTITAALTGNASTATAATNISGGAANQIPYNTALATTAFITAPTTAGTYLNWNGSAFAYSAISTPASVTFNNGGSGDASGTSFNGSTARTISYNTVGAPSTGGTGATGTWGISISGNAATATSATSASTATYATTAGSITGQANSATITATSANTGSQIVLRDSSGNFSAGTITASLSGNATTSSSTTGNAATATLATKASTLAQGGGNGTAMTFNWSGQSGQPTWLWGSNDGTNVYVWNPSNFSVNYATSSGSSSSSTYATTAGSITSQANSATITASSSNTANQIVLRDASGNFSAGTITATLSGNASTATTASNANTVGGFTPSQSSGVANRVVVANGSGYIDNSYFYTSGGGSERSTSGMGYFAGFNTSDYYIRSFTAAAVASLLSGQTMNINGSSTSCSGNAATATTATNLSGGTINGLTLNQYNANNPRLYAATTGATGLLGVDSAGTFKYQLYGDGTNYGFLNGAWAGWDLQKVINGELSLWVSSVQRTVLHSGNYTSYAPSLTGSGASGTWSINVTGSAGSATTATTATTANALATGNNYQVNSLGVGTAASGTAGEIRATNNVTAYYSSDIKFKENVRNIPNAAITAAAIGGKLFDWRAEYIEEHGGEDGYFIQKADFGVIAQDVLAKFPVAVRTRPDGSLAVDYEKLSALALAANAEHEARISKLEALVAKLIEG